MVAWVGTSTRFIREIILLVTFYTDQSDGQQMLIIFRSSCWFLLHWPICWSTDVDSFSIILLVSSTWTKVLVNRCWSFLSDQPAAFCLLFTDVQFHKFIEHNYLQHIAGLRKCYILVELTIRGNITAVYERKKSGISSRI